MKIVVVNSGNHGSVGNIILGVSKKAYERGHQTFLYCPPGRMQTKGIPNNHFIGTVVERRLSDKLNYFFGTQGSFNLISTYLFIRKLRKLSPDVIHIHNLHTNYINLNLFFNFLEKYNGKVVWTFHDCWPFTGHCAHFDAEGCMKWQTECCHCPLYKSYPSNMIDRSSFLFKKKKNLFSKVDNLTIVVPSEWLKRYVLQSFLKHRPVRHIPNGIDLSVFTPTYGSFRKDHSLENKFIILSVAFSWGYKKGLDRIEKLAGQLDERFRIVLVGISSSVVRNKKILCIERTSNRKELAEIYTTSDVLLNPTREDTFPTVNLEALACGTPVLSYGAGGSAEAFDETCGMIVTDETVLQRLNMLYKSNFREVDCIKRAEQFDENRRFSEYVNLYEEK